MMLSQKTCFELEASPEEGQSLQHKDKKGEKGKAEKKDIGHFLIQRLKILISVRAQANML